MLCQIGIALSRVLLGCKRRQIRTQTSVGLHFQLALPIPLVVLAVVFGLVVGPSLLLLPEVQLPWEGGSGRGVGTPLPALQAVGQGPGRGRQPLVTTLLGLAPTIKVNLHVLGGQGFFVCILLP